MGLADEDATQRRRSPLLHLLLEREDFLNWFDGFSTSPYHFENKISSAFIIKEKEMSMKRLVLAGLGMLMALAGCAVPGMVAPPPVHIYSPSEMLQPGPHQDLKPTGVQEYCAFTYDHRKAYAAQMKNAALANIAKACGGEDNYYVLKDMQANDQITIYGAFGTAGSICSHSDAHAIYFKCKGTTPQSSATTK